MTRQRFEQCWEILPRNSRKALLKTKNAKGSPHYYRPRWELFRLIAKGMEISEEEAARLAYEMRGAIERGEWQPIA